LIFKGAAKLCLPLVFHFLLAGCFDSDHPTPDTRNLKLSRMLDSVVEEYNAPGAVLAVKFLDESVFFHASGYADTVNSEPLTPEHLFRIGSPSKSVTASAVLLLYQQGLLSLDDSVETILPGIIPMYGDDITVRMLLNHTSGLKDYVGCPYENSYFWYVLIDDPIRSWTPKELVDIAVACGIADTPGDSFLYSNTNYILLGMIIEAVSGQSFEDYVHTNIFDALNMTNSSVPLQNGFPGDFARGYYEKDENGLLYDYSIQNPSALWAAGNMISTPADLLIWAEALDRGYLLDDDAYYHQFQLVEIGEDAGYGLGVLVDADGSGHNGSVLGYQIQMFVRKGAIIVIYTNCYYETQDNVSWVIYEKTADILDGIE